MNTLNQSPFPKPCILSTLSSSFSLSFQNSHHLDISLNPDFPFPTNHQLKKSFIQIKEVDLKLCNADLWLAFDITDLKLPLEDLLYSLKDQFESINIVKIVQAYHLQPTSDLENLLITGWKLLDSTILSKILNHSKPLFFIYNNLPLKYHLIGSLDQLKQFLKQKRLDQKLKQIDLFSQEYITPLPSLHLQGFFYYEFDFVDISPEITYVLCGVPPETSDAELISYITKDGLPEPIDILRNPLEGQSNIRITFSKASDADLFKFQGLKIPIQGEFQFKPIIILPVKDRSFDLCAEITKYQVLLKFEGDAELNEKTQIQVLKEIQDKYGPMSDVTIVFSKLWVISFQGISSPVRCLETSKSDNFSLKISISKPAKPYPCSGFLFQDSDLPLHNNEMPERPPKLVKIDPNTLKIQSELFHNSPLLKRRYQKIYLRQLEEAQEHEENEAKQVEAFQNQSFNQEEINIQTDMKESRRKKARAKKAGIFEGKENNKKINQSSDDSQIIEELDQLMMTIIKKKKIKTGSS